MHVKLLLASGVPPLGLSDGGAGGSEGEAGGAESEGDCAGAGGAECGTSQPMQLLTALHMLERACPIAAHVVALVTALVLRKHPKDETE